MVVATVKNSVKADGHTLFSFSGPRIVLLSLTSVLGITMQLLASSFIIFIHFNSVFIVQKYSYKARNQK